jgi:integrase
LTGARRGEVGGMRWSEIDKGKCLWTIPGERTKNRLVLCLPLSAQATAIIQSVTRIKGDHVLTATGRGGLGNFSRAKERIDARMKGVSPWIYHDIRRTVSTGLHSIDVEPHVVEAVLNHSSAHKSGVAGHYNWYSYLPQKTVALQRWADHVDRIVAGREADNVLPLRKRPSRVSGGKA